MQEIVRSTFQHQDVESSARAPTDVLLVAALGTDVRADVFYHAGDGNLYLLEYLESFAGVSQVDII